MKKSINYRLDIQGLRAIAVLAVWIFHIDKNILPGGFIGVDMFFVISGYIISSILWKQKEEKRFSFIQFYYHRIRRIVPAYYCMLLFVLFLLLSLYFIFDIKITLFIESIFFASNIYFSSFNDYFGASSYEQPLLHTWSVAIEMQFYLILPFILYFLRKKWALIIIALLTIILFAYSQYQINQGHQQQMYFSLLARSPEFLLGVLLAGFAPFENLKQTKQSILASVGIIIIIVTLFIYNQKTVFPGISAILPCLGTALVLGNRNGWINNFISTKFFVFIGNISYSIYLWHWVLLATCRYYLDKYDLGLSLNIILIIVTFIISYLSYKYIENTFRYFKIKKLSYTLISCIIGLAMLLYFSKEINSSFLNLPTDLIANEHDPTNHGSYSKDKLWGDTRVKNSYLLLGDSHALNMKTFIDIIGKKNNFSFRSITNNVYPTFPKLNKDKNNSHLDICYNDYEQLIPHVEPLIKKSQIIFLESMFFVNNDMDYLASLKAIDSLISPNQQVILISDFPTLGGNRNPIMINRSVKRSESKIKTFGMVQKEVSPALLKFIDEHPNFHYLNLKDSYIFNNPEFPYCNDTIMYYDNNHLNIYGIKQYVKYSEKKFMQFLDSIKRK